MSAKELGFDVEARARLKRGVDKLTQAVRVTLGPKGRNVVIDRKFGSPTVTKDGVSRGQRGGARGSRGEHGSPDGEGGRDEDVRRRR